MCLLIAKPANTPAIPMSYIENAFINNPDGAGLSYRKDGAIITRKTTRLKEFKSFMEELDNKYDAVIHFRFGTSGKKGVYNVHPFDVFGEGTQVVAHNGVFGDYSYYNTDESDTHLFVKLVLRNLPTNWYEFDGITELISNQCGTRNKLVFLDKEAGLIIINEEAGHYEDGIWYSNKSYSYGSRDIGGSSCTFKQVSAVNKIPLPNIVTPNNSTVSNSSIKDKVMDAGISDGYANRYGMSDEEWEEYMLFSEENSEDLYY